MYDCFTKLDEANPYDQLSKLLRCDAETGKLFWKPRTREMFRTERHCRAWNTNFAGKEAFTAFTSQHYKAGAIFGVKYSAHRIVWLLVKGRWPSGQIDHIDGNRANNCISNLREVDVVGNAKNMKMRSDNRSGVSGVVWDKEKRKWRATVTLNGRSKELGRFAIRDDAVKARLEANKKYGFSVRHGLPQ